MDTGQVTAHVTPILTLETLHPHMHQDINFLHLGSLSDAPIPTRCSHCSIWHSWQEYRTGLYGGNIAVMQHCCDAARLKKEFHMGRGNSGRKWEHDVANIGCWLRIKRMWRWCRGPTSTSGFRAPQCWVWLKRWAESWRRLCYSSCPALRPMFWSLSRGRPPSTSGALMGREE